MSVVGVGHRRLEGAEKVAGATKFTADLELPGLLYVQLVLSHQASANIRGIDVAAARSVPGVVDIVTGADLPSVPAPSPEKPLAVGRVFYVGQPVVAVIAESEAAAADAAALVDVDYEPLEITVDPEHAMREGATRVLDAEEEADAADASMHGAGTDSESNGSAPKRPANVSSVVNLKRGDTAAALKSADAVIKATYSLAGVHHSPMEPHVSMVRPEPDGGMTVWAPTQGPFALRDEVAKVLGIPTHKVRVVPMTVGGGFGGKVTLLETLLVLLARRTGRALRLNLTRQQVFAVARSAPAASFDIELGARKDGTLVALVANFHYDNGATAGWHGGITGMFLTSTYACPNFEITGYEVSTNKTPVEAYRAPGAPQAYFALESALDELALELKMDPVALRLKNARREGDPGPDGKPLPAIGMIECLQEAAKHPLYTRALEKGEGVGIALGMWGGARTPSSAGCRVEPDGTLTVHVGTVDVSGASTGLAMIAAESFGIPVDRVRIQTSDTATAPFGPVAAGSQVTYSMGGAVQEAALEARRQLLEIATNELEAAPEDLEIVDGRVTVRGVPERYVEVTKLVEMSTEFMGKYRPIQATGRSAVQAASPMFTVHIARVRTDPETGAFQLTGYAAIQDVGRAINPPEAMGQIHGGVVQGLGRALGEQLAYSVDGQLRTSSFLDYELPTADQLPEIDVKLVEVASAVGPLGAKGVGEPPAVPGPAAITNALARATGIRLRDVPLDRAAFVR
ncbi:MAG TPA: xanthine dehydrogenase family protein molybdopterin-binding subunit [Candidatus Dormibacteraeota bacterium]|nr:xanthine dehydrogenase family protein molybdopterin-binding subunit [Candidatus Dormibacteraeota bacterium]